MCVDYDPPDFYRETHHTARRKAHQCIECNRTIDIGEGYWRHFGVVYGETYGGVTCEQCQEAAHWLVTVCDGYLHNDAENELGEHLAEPYPIGTFGLGRLVVMMRRKWLRRDGTRWTPEQVAAVRKRALRPWREWEADQRWAAALERERTAA